MTLSIWASVRSVPACASAWQWWCVQEERGCRAASAASGGRVAGVAVAVLQGGGRENRLLQASFGAVALRCGWLGRRGSADGLRRDTRVAERSVSDGTRRAQRAARLESLTL